MPEFKYVGITSKGKSASGKIVAKNSKEAKEKLQEEGLTPLKLINDKSGTKAKSKNSNDKTLLVQSRIRLEKVVKRRKTGA